jgi:hypothetical protein
MPHIANAFLNNINNTNTSENNSTNSFSMLSNLVNMFQSNEESTTQSNNEESMNFGENLNEPTQNEASSKILNENSNQNLRPEMEIPLTD